MFRYNINFNLPIPIYQQIILAIKLEILSGRLKTGDKLPPIRKLAKILKLNPNTVAKAYYNLEGEGFIESKIIDHSILSPITSIVTSNHIIPNEKPFVGLAATGKGMIKVSARGTSLLVNQGLDLGAALRVVVADESISGEAGGHNIAAGAIFPQGHEVLFIDKLDTTLRKQMEPYEEESTTND